MNGLKPLLAATLLLLSACNLLTVTEPQPDTYRLHGGGLALPDPSALPASMIVATPVLPRVLEGTRIAVFLGPQEVSWYAGVRWAAPLDELVHQALIEVLEAGRPVLVDPALTGAARYTLRVALRDFQAVYADRAALSADLPPMLVVSLTVALVESRSGKVVAQHSAARREAAADNSIGAVTSGLNRWLLDAFSECLGALAALPT